MLKKPILTGALGIAALLAGFFLLGGRGASSNPSVPALESPKASKQPLLLEIIGVIGDGETLYDIFLECGVSMEEFLKFQSSVGRVFGLKGIRPGRDYSLVLGEGNKIESFSYSINDDSSLKAEREDSAIKSRVEHIEYERSTDVVSGAIKGNLVSVLDIGLALSLSDIFSWDIDFTTDLRAGDSFRIVAEKLSVNGEFRKYGKILAAEFVNNGNAFNAYRFERGERADYFDRDGNSLRKAFLKAPLSYRRISSGFTKSRYHPILKISRPHLGVDYAAAAGTPVASIGDGIVEFAAYKGQNGRLCIIRHRNGYTTYYGHLAGFARGIRGGASVKQGQVIGYVGSTGLSTGPHLDFRIALNGKFVDPVKLSAPKGEPVAKSEMAEFIKARDLRDALLASGKAQKPKDGS